MTDSPDPQPVSFDKQSRPDDPPAAGPSTAYPPGYPPPYPYAYAPGYGYPPPPYGWPAGPPNQKPSSNIGWAVGALFAFWPLAIPAFIYATRVDSYWFSGNRPASEDASRNARTYGMIGVIVGVVMLVVVFGAFALLVASSTSSSNVTFHSP